MVGHCLLIETERAGLLLVDSGLGARDVVEPARLPVGFRLTARPRLDPAETAIEQIRRLGYDPADVRNIAITHLDLDHAGGIADFPWATVHVHAAELAAARAGHLADRARYVSAQWSQHAHWRTYGEEGDDWFGLRAVRGLADVDDVALVPLFGHSRGHCGIAARVGERWLLHAGDAYFHHREIDEVAFCPPGLALFGRLTQVDSRARRQNQRRLGELRRRNRGGIDVFCAHDPDEFDLLRAR
jgi:glyoxylase-like metal-dependent hydrolase (beta-lactamase superfamily II)